MIKNILKITILLFTGFGYSQETDYTPNIIPPTPEAFKFASIGEIPVNESTGNATTSIPIYNFTAGKIQIPISIDHSGDGVKVDEANTWTGIGWVLNTGGVITRTVNDQTDERTPQSQRLFYSGSQLNSFVPGQSSELASLSYGNIDSEVDIFNYNFDGYSGSFYLDVNLVPRLIKYDKEIDISLSNDPVVNGVTTFNRRTITITTPDGTKYFFGGLSASEETKSKAGAGGFTPLAQTGFYLFKIENITGDIVNLNYLSTGSILELNGYSQVLIKDVTSEGLCWIPPLTTVASPRTPFYLESSGKLRLSSITSNRDQSKVEFESIYYANTDQRQKLQQIKVYSNNTTIVKKIDFNYIEPNPNQSYKRFFLNSVSILDANNNLSGETYSFEYNSPELLPERFSYSQDYGGFYNGKTNTTYIPKVNDPFFSNVNSSLADRTVSSITSQYGSLKKVIYPTKGFTEFEYEVGEKSEVDYEKENRFLNIYHNYNNTNLHTSTANTFPLIPDDNLPTPITILNPSLPIKVSLNIVADGTLTQHHFVKFTLNDMDSTNDIVKIIPLENPDGGQKIYNLNYEFANLNPLARYSFTLEYYRTNLTIYPTYLNANAQIMFSNNNPITLYKPGIRVKRVKNYANVESTPQVTRYYYNSAAKYLSTKDSGTDVGIPRFSGEAIKTGSVQCQGTGAYFNCTPYTIYQKKLFSNTQSNIYSSGKGRDMFRFVTVSYGGDNFEKGGKQTEFFVQADLPMNSISFNDDYSSTIKSSNTSLKNGSVLNEIYFDSAFTTNSQTNQITTGKKREIINTYLTLSDKSNLITNCYTVKIFDTPECLFGDFGPLYVGNYYFGRYDIFSWWHTLESTTTKEYFQNGVVESTSNYFYDSKLAGIPSRVLESDGVSTKEIKYFYPQDIEMVNEPCKNELIAKKIIGIPLATQYFKDNNKVLETKTVYKNWGNNLLAPEYIQSSKELLTPEIEIRYTKIDNTNGNPLELKKENGVYVSYIWGYNKTRIIAKIENATNSQIITALGISNLNTLSEANLTAINGLRNILVNAMVTTYTYIPLIGISTVTDPIGDTTTYNYDEFNRLKAVYNKDGQMISENQYHYKPQN